MWRGWKQAISLYENDILLPNRIAGIGSWRERFVTVDIHILSCQRINKGHSFISFQVATLVSFPQPPPLPEIGRREVLIFFFFFLPISSRARNEQLNLGLPCGLWVTVHTANHRGTKADNNKKRGFFIFCLPFRILFTLSLKGKLSSHPVWKSHSMYSLVSNLKLSGGKVGMSAWGQGIYIRPCSLPLLPSLSACVDVCVCPSVHLPVPLCQAFARFLEHIFTLSFSPHSLIPFSLIFLSVKPFSFSPFQPEGFFSSSFLSLSFSKFTSQQIVL